MITNHFCHYVIESVTYDNSKILNMHCTNYGICKNPTASTYVPHAMHSKRRVSPTIGLVGKAFGKLLTISGSC